MYKYGNRKTDTKGPKKLEPKENNRKQPQHCHENRNIEKQKQSYCCTAQKQTKKSLKPLKLPQLSQQTRLGVPTPLVKEARRIL